jgi:hypothetical protein
MKTFPGSELKRKMLTTVDIGLIKPSSLSHNKIWVTKMKREGAPIYHMQVPFSYFISNGKETKKGKKHGRSSDDLRRHHISAIPS